MKPSNPKTFKLGLIGYPLGHSKSPELHRGFLAQCGLKGDYALYPVPPEDKDALKELLTRVRTGEIDGLNVTIPHKQNVIPLLDELSETAEAIGAVNTIYAKNGKLIGENTDAPGFWKDVQNLRLVRSQKNALVLGSGGAARAVVYALLNAGWQITIATRHADIQQAQTLIKDYATLQQSSGQARNTQYAKQLSNIEIQASSISPLLSTLSLIVNTTPVGMSSHLSGSPYPKDLPFPPDAALYDLIYNPSKTQLMRDAENAGLKTRGGIGMLKSQAMLSFEIWTGCKL
jgi:shikimate dehydrogenase